MVSFVNRGKVPITFTSSPIAPIHNKHVLHTPTTTNLIYVHKLSKDNDAFIDIHCDFFFFKEKNMERVLFHVHNVL